MFGSHLSVAGGLHQALLDAQALGMDCVQIFTRNQRRWTVAPLGADQLGPWAEHRRRTGIRAVVSHDSYLINLAGPPGGLRSRSIALFRQELLRCEALDIAHLVAHPGSHLGAGESSGLRRVARALDKVHHQLPGLKVRTCLEVTAGQGTGLGHRFEHLRRILDLVREPQRLAVCLDTAHLLAAGYDLTSGPGCRAVLDELDDVLGLGLVAVLHLNDSRAPRASRVDRHAHIGHGHVAAEAFALLVNHRRFRPLPKILETPKENAPDGRPWDAVNLETLRGLLAGRQQGKTPRRLTGRKRPPRIRADGR